MSMVRGVTERSIFKGEIDMSKREVSQRRMFTLAGAALGGAVIIPSFTAPAALGASGVDSEVSERLAKARGGVNEGEQLLVQRVEGGGLWVQKSDGVVSTQCVAAGDRPLAPSAVTEIWNDGAPEGAEESIASASGGGSVAPAASS